MKGQNLGRRLILFLLGLILIQFGVAAFLNLKIGSDPFTVFTQGIAKLTGLSAGWANRVITLILCVIMLFCDRKYIKVGTLLAIVVAGYFLDAFDWIIQKAAFDQLNFAIRCLLFVVAMMPISLGIPMIKHAEIGVAPNDSVYFALQDHLKKPYRFIRMSTDAIYFVLGVCFGGVIGAGTVICLVVLGPMTDFISSKLERPIQRFLKSD